MNPDSEAVYDAEIWPLMAQIIDICTRHKIPMLASFQYADETQPGGPAASTTRIPFDGEMDCYDQAVRLIMGSPVCFGLTITTSKEGK
jgi:hypothetical protein